MDFNINILKNVLIELLINDSTEIFNNEREFQIALKNKLKEKFKNAGIFMECMFPLDKEINIKNNDNVENHIDLIVYDNQKTYPIELKYKAKLIAGTDDYNIHRCNFLQDIILTEKTIEQYNFECGYCIFLTNDEYLFTDKNETKVTKDLKICNIDIKAGFEYKRAGKNNNLREKYLFQNSYKFRWDKIEAGVFNNFRILVVSIPKKD